MEGHAHEALTGIAAVALAALVCGMLLERLRQLSPQLDGLKERIGAITEELMQENAIELSATGQPGGTLGIRVTQVTRADLGLVRYGYFGLNTSDIERQRAFYEMLGFKGEIYPAGPETSTTFARSLGFDDNYLIYVSLHSLQNPPVMPFVDTVQFRGDSYREEPPYTHLNHIGMACATYSPPISTAHSPI